MQGSDCSWSLHFGATRNAMWSQAVAQGCRGWAEHCQKLLINSLVLKSDHPLCSERSYLYNYFFLANSLPTHWKVNPRANWIFQPWCGEVGTAPCHPPWGQSTHDSQGALSSTWPLHPKLETKAQGKGMEIFLSTMSSLGNGHFSSHLNLYSVFISHNAYKCILLEKCSTNGSWGFSGMVILLICLNLLCLRGVLGLSQLAPSSPGLWRLQPWVWSPNLKSCFLDIFKQFIKLRVETQNYLQPSAQLSELCTTGFAKNCSLGLKNDFQYFSSKDCTSQKDFLLIWLGSSIFGGEKSLIDTGNC